MNKLHYVKIPIYHTHLYVFFGDKEECVKSLQKAKKGKRKQSSIDTTLETMSDSRGCFIQSIIDYYNLLWLPILPNTIDEFSTLIHEIAHATFYILDNAGLVHTKDSDEAYAYLQAFIFSEVDVIINKIKDKEHNELDKRKD